MKVQNISFINLSLIVFLFTDLCVNSVYIDSIGYNKYPGSCNKFVQCYNNYQNTKAVLRECPAGLFWHQDHAMCKSPDKVPCFEGKNKIIYKD